jgi:uncharacterized membrane protein
MVFIMHLCWLSASTNAIIEIIEINQRKSKYILLVLIMQLIGVYCKNHMEPVSALCGKMRIFLVLW